MKKQVLILKGYINKINKENKKLEVLFPAESIDKFTKDFLTKYYQNNKTPLFTNGFYVKYSNNSVAYIDKKNNFPTLIDNLLDKEVELHVELKHYNFMAQKKRIVGWNINLISMHPL